MQLQPTKHEPSAAAAGLPCLDKGRLLPALRCCFSLLLPLLLVCVPCLCYTTSTPLLDALHLSAASLTLPGQDPSDPSAATIYQRALERQALYADLETETQRQGLLLGHEVMGTVTQSEVFDKVTRPGTWRKPTVKAKLKPLEVRRGWMHNFDTCDILVEAAEGFGMTCNQQQTRGSSSFKCAAHHDCLTPTASVCLCTICVL